MQCLSDNGLLELLEGKLTADAALAARAHLETCADCRALYQEVAGLDAGELERTRSEGHTPAVTLPLPPARAAAHTIGRYVVLEAVGSGAMGVVYAAYDPQLDRKVAVKLLHRPDEGSAGALRAEAQALARLAHPNVIAVHDVGTAGDQVFVAMEFVDGQTLKQWLATPQPAAEVLRRFVQAAEGLAAAHRAGLVHRDFKPENVLCGRDGRVRVTDFGLARAQAAPAGDVASELDVTRTRTQGLVGTPAYMAPEQLRGESADARADQFAFCVALYEALYGARPFSGDSIDALRESASAGIDEPPRKPGVRGVVRRALARGLSPQPDGRHASMRALIRELEHDGAAPRRRLAAAGGAALLVLSVAAWGAHVAARERQRCGEIPARLRGVWDDGVRAAGAEAFRATHKAYALDAWARARALLDRFSTAWVDRASRACHDPPAAAMRRAVDGCLTDRLAELGQLSRLLLHPDTKTVEHAAEAALALTPVGRCEAAVLSARPMPAGPSPQLVGVRADIAEAKELRDVGAFSRALPVAKRAADGAAGLDPGVHAEALALYAATLQSAGDPKDSERAWRDTVWAAEAAGDDDLRARAWIGLIFDVGYRGARYAEGFDCARHAQAIIARSGGSPELEARRLSNLGILYTAEHKLDQALDASRRALELRESLLSPEDPQLALSLMDLGNALSEAGRYDEALRYLRRALALAERALGPSHPHIGVIHSNIGRALNRQGRYPDALVEMQSAARLFETALGPDHPDLAMCLNNLADTERQLGHIADARRDTERALAIGEKTLGPDHPDIATFLTNLGDLTASAGDFGGALRYQERALAIDEKALGRDDPGVAYDLTGVGRALIGLRRGPAATVALERSLRIRETHPVDPADLADTRYTLARALVLDHRQPARARQLLCAARAVYAEARPVRPELAELDAFTAKAELAPCAPAATTTR